MATSLTDVRAVYSNNPLVMSRHGQGPSTIEVRKFLGEIPNRFWEYRLHINRVAKSDVVTLLLPLMIRTGMDSGR